MEAVRTGYIIARSKKAAQDWDRRRSKGTKRQIGMTGAALERVMSNIIMTHPEFLKGVPRPRTLQPRALWGAAAAARRAARRAGKAKG